MQLKNFLSKKSETPGNEFTNSFTETDRYFLSKGAIVSLPQKEYLGQVYYIIGNVDHSKLRKYTWNQNVLPISVAEKGKSHYFFENGCLLITGAIISNPQINFENKSKSINSFLSIEISFLKKIFYLSKKKTCSCCDFEDQNNRRF